MFSREKIKEAKQHVHQIAFQPDRPKKDCTVEKVRDGFVWVRVVGDDISQRLNRVASGLLIAGNYRK